MKKEELIEILANAYGGYEEEHKKVADLIMTDKKRAIKVSFYGWLQERFIDNNSVLDDDIPDAFNEWLCKQDVEGIIDLADEWGRTLIGGQLK